VTGYTQSSDFPTRNAVQPALRGQGDADAFVTKISPAGDRFVYSTYLGGSAVDSTGNHTADYGTGIAVDGQGIAYVVGGTQSNGFPLARPLQDALRGGQDAFVTALDPTGQRLLQSTYLGGHGSDWASDIAVDGAGNLYVSGSTNSSDFPGATPAGTPSGNNAAETFLEKLSAISLPATPTPTSTPIPTAASTPASTPTPTPRVVVVPVVSAVPDRAGAFTASFTVTFSSQLPGQGEVYFGSGPGCRGLVEVATRDLHPGTTEHTVVVTGNDLWGTVGDNRVLPGTTYWYELVTVTKTGTEVDDNGGKCYSVPIPAM
jgi:hypothetical protein